MRSQEVAALELVRDADRMRRLGLLCLLLALSGCGSDDSSEGGAGTAGNSGAGGSSGNGGHSGTGGSNVGGTAGTGGGEPTGNIVSLDGGRYHTCLTTKSGKVYCWGQGAYGALGNDGSYRGVPTLAKVVTDATDVHCGGRFTCARQSSKGLLCWGEDQAGQLAGPDTKPCGDATIDSVCAPVAQPVAGLAAADDLALGRDHSCALATDGTVWCWGSNASGQLGDPSLVNRMEPAQVAGVSGAVAVTAGDEHSCALIGSPGKVLCWGQNANAQIGAGKVTDSEPTPIEVAGITDAVEIAAGGEHTCVRHASGTLSCWGYNYFGQLGNGSKQPTRASSPVDVVELSDVVELALGRYHTCARRSSGGIACWGFNEKGELGDGTSTARVKPVDVVTIADAWHIAAGSWHTCTILASGPVMCWGDNLGGQLGIDAVNKVANPTPVAVHELPID